MNTPKNEDITPTYQELLNWLESQGKTEHDLFVFWANMDYEAFRDMTRKEMVEALLDGIVYDRKRIMGYWDDADETQRQSYKTWMLELWEK